MSSQFGNQVFGELQLSGISSRPVGEGTDFISSIIRIPCMIVTCFYNLYFLVGIVLFECRQHIVECGQGAMIIRIIAQPDDIVIIGIVFQRLIEVRHILRLAQLCLNDNLCLGAHLTNSSDACLQVFGKVGKRTTAIVAAIRIAMASRPQHAVSYLVAWLHKVGCCPCCYHLVQTAFGILVESCSQCLRVRRCPAAGSGMFAWISPSVAVVEIQHQCKSGVFDLLT